MGYLPIEQRLRRLSARLEEMSLWVSREVIELSNWCIDGKEISCGDSWPSLQGNFLFEHPEIEVPKDWPLENVRLQLDLGGEGMLSITGASGEVRKFGLDPYHQNFPLYERVFTPSAKCVARLLLGRPNWNAKLAKARLVWEETSLADLILLMTQIEELARTFGGYEADHVSLEKFHPSRPHPDHSKPHDVVEPLLDIAEAAVRLLEWPTETSNYIARYSIGDESQTIWQLPNNINANPEGLSEKALASVKLAHESLLHDLARLKERFPQSGEVVLTGHAHIDLAWLWPIAETRRKALRTFNTTIGLMDENPDYRFNQSTAQYYAYLEEDDPELLEEIKLKVAAGQWEIIGGMWVEPDVNMPTGESLVRQLLYGIAYFDRVFGKDKRSRVNWLPDCFGFTPALPQLLRLADMDSVFTHKTNWSEINKIPSDLFWWVGIDGSRVLMHTFDNPEGGYNGRISPKAAIETWDNFQDKSIQEQTLFTFGWGDGGGGPTQEMLTRIKQMKDFPAMPKVRQVNVSDWYGEIHKSAEAGKKLPDWVGELYLEYHRGTLTTQGRTKFLHRRSERGLIAAEALASFSTLLGGKPSPGLEDQWQVLLRNEFHDILPGSSIREVYVEAEKELEEVIDATTKEANSQIDVIASYFGTPGEKDLLVANTEAFARPFRLSSTLALPGGQQVEGGSVLCVDRKIAGLSVTAISADKLPAVAGLSVGSNFLENKFIRVGLNADGTLNSVYDKQVGRECLEGRGNQIWAYVDKPRAFDAWDIEEDYETQGEEVIANEAFEVIENGPHRVAIRIKRKFRSSTIVQTIRLWANSARIDFKTDLDWHDRRILLKARFPLAIKAEQALFECAHGVIARPTFRNTSWEQAKYEVSAHRFVDLSENRFGVALLNDGKYGHHALGNELGISLLRSPVFPDVLADEGEQSFTYALLPHEGDWLSGGVLAEAEDLNLPLFVRPLNVTENREWRAVDLSGLPVALSGFKTAEDGETLVLRTYEPAGARGDVSVTLPQKWNICEEVNLLEERSGNANTSFTPFQIHSWRLKKS